MARPKNCANIIVEQAEGLISRKEAEEFLTVVAERSRQLRNDGDILPLAEILQREGNKILQNNILDAKRIKRNVELQAKRFQEITDKIETAGSEIIGIESHLVGESGFTRNSVDALQKAMFSESLGRIHSKLEDGNLLSTFNKDEVGLELAQELGALDIGRPVTQGVTNNKRAFEIAKILHAERVSLWSQLNESGASIGNLKDYVARTSHDSAKMRKAGFKAWMDTVDEKIDRTRTFRDRGVKAEDEIDFLESVYDNLLSGNHQRLGQGHKRLNMEGAGSVAKRLSHERIIHFKDARAWFEYNKDFGTRDVQAALINSFEFMSNDLALLKMMGPDPSKMLADLKQWGIDRLKPKLRDTNPKVAKKAQRQIDTLLGDRFDKQLAQLDGTANIIFGGRRGDTIAAIDSGIKSAVRMSTLGASVISSITDVHFSASEVSKNGGGYFSNFHKVVFGGGENLSKAGKQEFNRIIGIGAQNMIGQFHSRFDADGQVAGKRAKSEWLYFTMNGQRHWDQSHRRGTMSVVLSHWAEVSNKKWGDLEPGERSMLEMYEMNEAQWPLFKDIIRDDSTGTRYITPEKIHEISDSRITEITGFKGKKQIDDYRNRFEDNLRSYVVDRSDHAVPTPGAKERAALNFGAKKGTILGAAISHFAIFKSYPVTFVTKVLTNQTAGTRAVTEGRSRATEVGLRGALEGLGFGAEEGFVQGMREGKAAWGAMFQTLLGTTALGYIALQAKELAKGRQPRDFDSADTWRASLLQGGGLGIYGDFFFGEFNRFGISPTKTLVGPTANVFDSMGTLFAKWRNGDPAAAEVVRAMKNNMGFLAAFPPNKYVGTAAVMANMFYTKTAMDYMFLYQLQENLNPGYLRRMERRLKRENNQEFIISPR